MARVVVAKEVARAEAWVAVRVGEVRAAGAKVAAAVVATEVAVMVEAKEAVKEEATVGVMAVD